MPVFLLRIFLTNYSHSVTTNISGLARTVTTAMVDFVQLVEEANIYPMWTFVYFCDYYLFGAAIYDPVHTFKDKCVDDNFSEEYFLLFNFCSYCE